MGLFGRSEITLFTCECIKRLYQFFMLNFFILLFQIIVFVIIILGYTVGGISGIIYSFFTSALFTALVVILEIFIIIWLFWAFIDMVNGRKEFDKQHEIIVIIASAFLIPSIFLYIIQLILSKGLAVSSAAFYLNPTGSLAVILVQSSLLLTISIVIPILMGLALFLFIYKLTSQAEKIPLMFACGLLITSPFTLYITALIAYFLFFGIYRSVYRRLSSSNIRPTDNAPCPFCDKDIPIESKECPYCGTKFKESREAKLDPRLSLELPKKEINVPHGYTPVKGPTEEQKKRVFKIIGLIIAVIVIIAVVVLVLRGIDFTNYEEKFHGSWTLTSADYYSENYTTWDINLTFTPDGTFYTNNITGTWKLNDSNLRLTMNNHPDSPFEGVFMGNFEYVFSNNYQRLMLHYEFSHVADFTLIYEK